MLSGPRVNGLGRELALRWELVTPACWALSCCQEVCRAQRFPVRGRPSPSALRGWSRSPERTEQERRNRHGTHGSALGGIYTCLLVSSLNSEPEEGSHRRAVGGRPWGARVNSPLRWSVTRQTGS